VIEQLQALFSQHAEPQFARWQERYMRNQFPFIGIRQPIRKKLQKPYLKSLDITALWKLPEREWQYTAIDLLLTQQWKPEMLDLLECLITNKPWWDSVDVLASNACGKFFSAFPEYIDHTQKWISHPNLWLRRSALLFQLRYRNQTDQERLFSYCKTLSEDPEFFIQRAIAWALREYAKTDPSSVRSLLNNHSFSRLVSKEIKNIVYDYPEIISP